MKDNREGQSARDGATRRGMVKFLGGAGVGIGAVMTGKGAASATPAAGAPSGADLPFPPVPTASTAGPTLQESVHHRRA